MQMQCLACGGEMRLQKTAENNAMPVADFEYRTFECSGCGDVERRLLFVKHFSQADTDPDPGHTEGPISSTDEGVAAAAFGKRTLARLHGLWRALARQRPSRAPVPDAMEPPPGRPAAEPVPEPALEMVPELAPALPYPNENLPAPAVSPPPMSPLMENDRNACAVSDPDDCEVLLRRSIAMVHGGTHSPQPAADIDEPSLAPEAVTAAAAPDEGRPPRAETQAPAIAVRIHHDLDKGKFVATDVKSGRNILRHEDGTWLHAMCERMGWKVIGEAVATEGTNGGGL
jgi:hypothetical protein